MSAAVSVDAVYATESLSDALWTEIQPLLLEHYHEIAHYRDIPLSPSREMYQRCFDNGGLRIFTARADGKLIGYLAVFVSVNMHYQTILSAAQDVLYVDPAYRGSRVGVRMIRHAHERLADEGVTILFQHVKAKEGLNVGPLLTRYLGYELVDQIFAVRLDRCYTRQPGK